MGVVDGRHKITYLLISVLLTCLSSVNCDFVYKDFNITDGIKVSGISSM